jgi:hypothetical protein
MLPDNFDPLFAVTGVKRQNWADLCKSTDSSTDFSWESDDSSTKHTQG